MKQDRVGIRELKTNLSAVLRRVKAGHAVVITERGQPVGRILPAEMPLDAVLLEGARKRLWSWSGRKWRPRAPQMRPRGKKSVSELLLDDRE